MKLNRNLNTEINLIILGLLTKKKMSAYEMDRFIEKRGMRLIYKISAPAIYKNILFLSRNGYVDETVKTDSQYPQKKVYSINKKGKKLFEEIYKNQIHQEVDIYSSFDSLIAFGSLMSNTTFAKAKEEIRNKTFARIEFINSLKQSNLKENDKYPPPVLSLIERYESIYKDTIKWLDTF